jgi:hypothetical protein
VAGSGAVERDGLDGVVDGAIGDEDEREPRLPPLVARAQTVALSNRTSEISDIPNMSRNALGRMAGLPGHSIAASSSSGRLRVFRRGKRRRRAFGDRRDRHRPVRGDSSPTILRG